MPNYISHGDNNKKEKVREFLAFSRTLSVLEIDNLITRLNQIKAGREQNRSKKGGFEITEA